MSGTTTLPDALVELLAESYGEMNPATKRRWTLRELAAVANQQTGRTDIAHTTVAAAIGPLRAEWARIARDVARERIGQKLPAQLDALDDMLSKVERDFSEAGTPRQRAESVDTYRKGLLLKLRFSGVGERMEVDAQVNVDGTLAVSDARSALAAQLARAAPGAVADGAGAGDREPFPGSGGDPPP